MKTAWLAFLFLALSAFADVVDDLSAVRDTVYVEQIVRDTVYVPLKPKTDTVYIKKEVSSPLGLAEADTLEHCCRPTAENPLGRDTTQFPRNDSSYNAHLLYLQFDIVSLFLLTTDYSTKSVAGGLEIAFSRKNSLLANVRYTEKTPVENGGEETFDEWVYSGNITQLDMGLGWRHYTRPTRSSFFSEFGANFLIRKTDYVNKRDDQEHWINDDPHSDHGTYKGLQPYAHLGHAIRGNWLVLDLEYGISYNVGRWNDPEILKKHVMYFTSGLQLDIEISIGIGAL